MIGTQSELARWQYPSRSERQPDPNHLNPEMEKLMTDLDISIFKAPTQTSLGDRKSLLTIQHIIRTHVEKYVYLEIGSHLGGTLLPHLTDAACRLVYSVDKRPESQLDERGVVFDYAGNSTTRMINILKETVPESSLLKLITLDNDMSKVAASEIGCKADLILIDGEHTNVAVFRDFLFSIRFMKPSFIAVFHDANLLCDGLQNIEQFLAHQMVPFRSQFLPDCVFAISVGEFAHVAAQAFQRVGLDRQTFIETSRVTLWKTIASTAALIDGNTIGHV